METLKSIVEEMRKCYNISDKENGHKKADELLIETLTIIKKKLTGRSRLKIEKIIEEYTKVDKWYG